MKWLQLKVSLVAACLSHVGQSSLKQSEAFFQAVMALTCGGFSQTDFTPINRHVDVTILFYRNQKLKPKTKTEIL